MTLQRRCLTQHGSVVTDGNSATVQLRGAMALISLFLVTCLALPAFAQSQPIDGVLTLPPEINLFVMAMQTLYSK